MERRTLLRTVASLSIAGAVAGCSGGSGEDSSGNGGDSNGGGGSNNGGNEQTATPTSEPTPTSTPTPEQKDITLLEHELVESDLGNAEVEGRLKNTSGDTLDYIGVNVKFFDAEDTRIGDTSWNETDVDAGRELTFTTVMSTTKSDEVDSYEIEVGTSPF